MTERDPSADLQHVLQLAIGYMPAVALNIVVKLRIPNLIGGEPVRTEQLSQKTGVNEDRLYRILRALSTVGIFKNIRRALQNTAGGKVILLEGVVAGPGEPDLAKWGDLEMMAGRGGRERTHEEFQRLFERAGFHLDRIVPTKSVLSVIEASVA